MAYQYIAVTPQGDQVRGRIEASTEDMAEQMLWKLNYTIASLKEIQEDKGVFGLRAGVKTRDLIIFSQQLATLIESGIPIIRAIHLLQEQTANKRLKEILTEVVSDLQQGRFLSESIAKHKGVFPTLYSRLIEVGEKAGNLEMVLRQLAIYMEKEDTLVRKIRGALAYPSFVLVVAFAVIILMLTVALPPLMGLFKSFDAELPLPTRVLIGLTDFFSAYKFFIFGGLFGAIIAAVMFFRTEPGHLLLDRTLLKVPLIGRVMIQGAVARMCRSTATLLQAGLSLPEILDMVVRTQGNRIIAAALDGVRQKMLQGHGLADPLAGDKLFPGMLVQMVRVGEETGSLDSNLQTLAVFYEDEVDRAVSAMTSAMEPALTIFIGGVVGFVAIAVITPMYSLMGSVK